MKSVCFTGHRKIKNSYELKKRLIESIEEEIKNGAENFYAGGALGWDSLCALAVIAAKKKYPHIKLHLVLPCSNEEQTLNWSLKDKELFYNILKLSDSAEYTSEHYNRDCMKIRNAKLVEYADCCICCYSGNPDSGTGQTVNMAKKKGIPVHNLFI